MEKEQNPKEFIVTRTFNAPRNLVYKAFTDAESLAKWWGPKGFNMLVSKLELKPEGLFHYRMQSPEGFEMWGKFVYKEINAPEKIVFISAFSDEQGNTTRAPFSPVWPMEVLNVLTLLEENGKTTLTIKAVPVNATEEERAAFEAGLASMDQGFKGTFDQLDEFLLAR